MKVTGINTVQSIASQTASSKVVRQQNTQNTETQKAKNPTREINETQTYVQMQQKVSARETRNESSTQHAQSTASRVDIVV